ncbi:protein phosphatase 1 regulatory subunit 17 [Sparus aurata]|uniref:protein phosphatase 1 regulatory subunit 17 n=1 Tax=Sparus aurata TaxID=8175 RepID=UPI0011C15704|nr:protein phosphatase 1 regulatory subunit 17 [Sparus aurata]XP_030254895.1 protein phosphatase 1 regulatory subunit 17 [Sparus aurata]
MTTGCVRSTLEPEHRLMIQESMKYQEPPENLMDGKSKMKDDKVEDAQCSENHGEDQLKKPRRKDTPILNSPPQIPGVRPLKAEKPVVHLEDEEKDMKD